MKTYDIGISLETNRTFPEEKAKLFRLYLARDWKEVSYSKKCGITVYTRKEEVRIKNKIKCNENFVDLFYLFRTLMKFIK